MTTTLTHPGEVARLAALASYEVLDTPPDLRFDKLAGMAARLHDVPISLISLVDADRQWFKSSIGLSAKETPRDGGFCAHAVLEPDQVLVIENAAADPRFADHPLVTGDPYIRFYAGAPIITPEGFALGTLCIIDSKPRIFPDEACETLPAAWPRYWNCIAAVSIAAGRVTGTS